MTQFLRPLSCCLGRFFLPLNQFPSWGLIKLNWIELNMSWSRYEDAKAVWHLFSNTEMKYNMLILNAADRINCNDLRFFPGEFSAHARQRTRTYARLRRNCLGWAGERINSSKSLILKCYWCSFEAAARCRPEWPRLCRGRVVITRFVLLLFFQAANTIWAEDGRFPRRCCHRCW